uniref:Putative nuclease HARBI1 n=1 Tax=Tanacetum cinerariifolium TaxID=118510 RepID=A0A6L2LDI2_TANCI|nr:putative nuclease HARBI1 [Tanacetum cinerariifolium]
MNSYTFIGLDDVEEGEEISSRKKSFIKRVIAYIKIRRQASRLRRNSITKDRVGAHERLVDAFFSITRCTMQLDSGRRSEWLEWFSCPYAFKGKYVRRDHGSNPFILLEVVASQDLWIWHAFFGVAGSNNDINVLYQSILFNDLKTGRAPEIPFVANGVSYPSGYYLVDGIYQELAPLVKTISEPADDDHKRILYKQKQESARKYMERAFGVLQKKWVVLANPTRA